MHNTFQKDLYRLRLETAKAFAKSLNTSSLPITATHSMNISAQVWPPMAGCIVLALMANVLASLLLPPSQVQGMGPLFRLTITVQNTSPGTPIIGHYITFKCDHSLYRLSRPRIEVITPTDDVRTYFTSPSLLPLPPPPPSSPISAATTCAIFVL